MGIVKREFQKQQEEEREELQKRFDEHDCKQSPDSGCAACQEYQEAVMPYETRGGEDNE